MSMRSLLTALALSVGMLALPAAAQTGNPAGMTPGTPQAAPGAPAPHQPNQPDRIFIREATIAGMAEVETSKLAEQKGQSDAVKNFGRQMVRQHTTANDRLATLAKADNVPQPGEFDHEHQAMRERLETLSGAAFDRAYIQGQRADHQRTAQLLEYEIGSGQDAELKTFASETLPIVLQHLQMAQDIDAQMVGQASPVSAAPSSPGTNDGSTVPAPHQSGATGDAGTRNPSRQDRPPAPGGTSRGTTR
jgi:putative membrane protein